MQTFYRKFGKRVFDLVLSIPLLLLLLPLFLLIAIWIKIDSSGPVFFLQDRVGYGKRKFVIYKFRTMKRGAKQGQQTYIDDPLVTGAGRWLRRFRLDELPQFFNVLKGDMSLVGPRPMTFDTIDESDENCVKRFQAYPGCMCSTIRGSFLMSWPERWKMDVDYIENISFILDLKIIFQSFIFVILGDRKYLERSNKKMQDKKNES